MKTLHLLEEYFQGKVIELKPDEELESKKDLVEQCTEQFKSDMELGQSALLSFQVLYHRLSQVADVAKEVFYEDAISELEDLLKDADGNSTDAFGANIQLRESDNYKIVKSPKIQKLEKEIEAVEKKNEKTIKKYDQYKADLKSLKGQIKAEEERIISTGLATKIDTKKSISLKY